MYWNIEKSMSIDHDLKLLDVWNFLDSLSHMGKKESLH